MSNIRSLDIGEDSLKFNYAESYLCLYATLIMHPSAEWYQLSKDLGLSKDDRSLLHVITMAGWERVSRLECFSVEVIARYPIDLVDCSLIDNEIILFAIIGQHVRDQTYEICRQRVFHHDEKASQDNMVRVSALDPGVPFLEKRGENGSRDIRLPESCSLEPKVKLFQLMARGMALITSGKQPFLSLIEAIAVRGRSVDSGAVTEANKNQALDFVITKGREIYSGTGEVTKHKVARACGSSYGISAEGDHCIDKCHGCQAIDRLIKQCNPQWNWRDAVLPRIKNK